MNFQGCPWEVGFCSNSNFCFHIAGPWGLFLKAAKTCLILLNGSVALKFFIGQPQRRVSFVTDVFSACSEPLFKATGGRSTSCERICLAVFKKRPHGPALARPKGHNENCCGFFWHFWDQDDLRIAEVAKFLLTDFYNAAIKYTWIYWKKRMFSNHLKAGGGPSLGGRCARRFDADLM